MSLGLYMDVHVPRAITSGLRRRGITVLTAQEDGAERASDPEILRRALEEGLLLFSQDEDMIIEAVRCQRDGEEFATVILAPQIDLSIGRCIAEIETLPEAGRPSDAKGQIIFL